MQYERTQRGRWHDILFAVAGVMLIGTWFVRRELAVVILLLVISVIYLFCALIFGSLTIRDEGEWLALRYGPLPIIRKRFRYADITAVEPDRTKIIDGWGVHYIPGRGWTYNLWGFRCVKLHLGRKIVRLGTDDVDPLVAFLRIKLIPKSPTEVPPA
jgi:hypothetical protein